MTTSDDYLWDRSGPADPEVARLEELLSPLRHEAPLDELRLRRRRSRLPMFIAAGVAVAATIAVVLWWRSSGELACSGTAGFAFTAKGGTVACGGAAVASGVLPVGTTLDTGAHEAELAIADIGKAQLGARTRVRLDHTGERHQLYLEQGRMHARVSAPPRIFAVATPSADVTDLGCEYTIEIDSKGAGSIQVLTGKVELGTAEGKLIVVPAGSHARLLPGRRASVPLSDRAGPEITALVRQHENGVSDALARVLAASTSDDVITVANLAVLVPASQKRMVLERLAGLVPPPQSLTIEEVLADPVMFEMWFDEAVLVHLTK